MAEVVALCSVAARASESLPHGWRPDAFGYNIETKSVSHGHDGVHDRGVLGRAGVAPACRAQDEALVDLKFVGGQIDKVAERRIACAKVVDGDPHL